MHNSIQDVIIHDDDSEAILVVANPPTNETYLGVRSLIDGLQFEFDTSWAVLGEIYSMRMGLQSVGIRLRRVRSNLDDLEEFEKSISYIPGRFAFDSAGTDLLKQLVSPLYSHRPEIGVRELLQNAIDAVNEFMATRESSGALLLAPDVVPCVKIRVDGSAENGGTITIADDGIGMKAETIRSYFLRVGASYRTSDAWKRQFIAEGACTVTEVGTVWDWLLGDVYPWAIGSLFSPDTLS